MISLIEGAERTKTPNEIALTVLLAVLTLVFLIMVATVLPFANHVREWLEQKHSGYADRKQSVSAPG